MTTKPTACDIAAEIGPLRRYALVLVRDPDRAEDLVQEALANAIRSVGTWRAGGDLRRWLLAILHNAHASRRRRTRVEAAAIGQAGLLAPVATPAPQPQQVFYAETITALMALPEEQRSALILIAFEGLSYKDAAEILGLPVGTLMSRLARGREALRAATGRGGTVNEVGPAKPALRVVESKQ